MGIVGRWAAPSTPPTHFVILAQFRPFLGSLYWALQLKIWNATLPLPVWENLFLLYHVIWGASLNYIHVGSGSRKDLRKPGTYCFPLFFAQWEPLFPGADTIGCFPPKKHFLFSTLANPVQPTRKQMKIRKQKRASCLTACSLLTVWSLPVSPLSAQPFFCVCPKFVHLHPSLRASRQAGVCLGEDVHAEGQDLQLLRLLPTHQQLRYISKLKQCERSNGHLLFEEDGTALARPWTAKNVIAKADLCGNRNKEHTYKYIRSGCAFKFPQCIPYYRAFLGLPAA